MIFCQWAEQQPIEGGSSCPRHLHLTGASVSDFDDDDDDAFGDDDDKDRHHLATFIIAFWFLRTLARNRIESIPAGTLKKLRFVICHDNSYDKDAKIENMKR